MQMYDQDDGFDAKHLELVQFLTRRLDAAVAKGDIAAATYVRDILSRSFDGIRFRRDSHPIQKEWPQPEVSMDAMARRTLNS
jgi:hypothetical protein